MSGLRTTAKPALAAAVLAAALAGAAAAAPADTLRPEVGRPLQAAQELIRTQRFRDALAKVREAEQVTGRTAYESSVVERMRLAAASGAGDAAAAAASFESLDAAGRLAADERLRLIESIAGLHYRARDYAKAVQWAARYRRDGGTGEAMRTLSIQAQYLGGDAVGVVRELTVDVQAAERAGRVPAQERLELLLSAAALARDDRAIDFALERLIAHHPKPAYWVQALSRLQRRPGFSDRYLLDVYRLRLAAGAMRGGDDYVEMAQLALQAGLPGEAKAAVDRGVAAGVLGSGADAARQQRLRVLVERSATEAAAARGQREAAAAAAPDGEALVSLGLDRALAGDAAAGVALIRRGLAKDTLKRPVEAALRLGQAQVLARDAKAVATLRSVNGSDGAADVARLWVLLARRG